jgi:hypothetical protein
MRAWMIAQAKPWTVTQMCDALGVAPGKERDKVREAMPDFVGRMEIVPVGMTKQNRRQHLYVYNRTYRRIQKGVLNKKIFKAMYVAGSWALTDLQRLAGAPDRSYLDKILRRLRRNGYVRPVGRRVCAHGIGAETIYHMPDRDRFRREVMG